MSAEVIKNAEAANVLTTASSVLVGRFFDPDSDDWGTGEDAARALTRSALALKEAARHLSVLASEVDQMAADQIRSLDAREVAVDGVAYRPRKSEQKKWHPEKVGQAKDELRRGVTRTVGVNPATGELDELRCDLALRVVDQIDQWQTLAPRSFKSGFYRDLGLAPDEFYEASVTYKLEAVPQ